MLFGMDMMDNIMGMGRQTLLINLDLRNHGHDNNRRIDGKRQCHNGFSRPQCSVLCREKNGFFENKTHFCALGFYQNKRI